MNKIIKSFIFYILFLPIIVNATNINSEVYKGTNKLICINQYQDDSFTGTGENYFSHCMVSKCENNHYYSPSYVLPNKKFTCSNGNSSPKATIVKSGCPNLGSVCNSGNETYCSVIIKYDCGMTSDDKVYTTTTTTKKTTTTTTKKTTTTKRTTTKRTTTKRTTKKITTTIITTTKAPSNTKLKSLLVENGIINFVPEIYEYTLEVGSNVSSLNITAIPEDEKSKVVIKDNVNLLNGSAVSIVVTGEDGSISTYKINVLKEIYVKSNNAKLKSLSIEGYTLSFNSKINEYSLTIDSDTTLLNINYETEDEKSTVVVTGNENLTNGSRVIIKVTAEDGTENNYVINISVKKKTNAIKYVFIIILILAILAGAYYLYKKFVQGKKGDKYEYE